MYVQFNVRQIIEPRLEQELVVLLIESETAQQILRVGLVCVCVVVIRVQEALGEVLKLIK